MLKRMSCLFLLISLMVFAAGCSNAGEDSARKNAASGSVDDVLFQKISEEASADDSSITAVPDVTTDDGGITALPDVPEVPTVVEEYQEEAAPAADVDLTVLSSTMVYSEVYNMMVTPNDYIGKIVKIKGQFVPYYDESTDKYYFACFISDATACCSQGIEFILTDDYSYPEDYPQEGDTICVVGTFDTYMEGENMYCTLRNALLFI